MIETELLKDKSYTFENDPLIKVLRSKYNLDLDEAISMILSNPEWTMAMGLGYVAIMGFFNEVRSYA